MMQATEIATKKIQRIGSETISDDMLYTSIYKGIDVKKKLNKTCVPNLFVIIL